MPLLILVITLLISNLPPEILALLATMSLTISPSGTAPALIPLSSINMPTPSCENNANVKLPVASLPIWILTLPLLSLNCWVVPLMIIEPSADCIDTLLVLIVPVLILLALILSIMAFLISASAIVTLSAVSTNDWILSIVKLPPISVCISATKAFKLVMSALTAVKSPTFKLSILALTAVKFSVVKSLNSPTSALTFSASSSITFILGTTSPLSITWPSSSV